jgi:hypothetical protein
MSNLGRAIQIAVNAHDGQLDKGGSPYILHPLWVMNQVRHLGEDHMIVAILHDVVEDTEWTLEKLREEGFAGNIIYALGLLDFRNIDYDERIREIAVLKDIHPIARAVKMKDIEHNSRVTRLKGLREKDIKRLEKYFNAYSYLKNVKNMAI